MLTSETSIEPEKKVGLNDCISFPDIPEKDPYDDTLILLIPFWALSLILKLMTANKPFSFIGIFPWVASLNKNLMMSFELLLLKLATGSGTISPASTELKSNISESNFIVKSQLLIPISGTFCKLIGTLTVLPGIP